MQLDISDNKLTDYGQDMSGVKALADALSVNPSVSHLDARGNNLGDEGKAILREAVKDKLGFELLL